MNRKTAVYLKILVAWVLFGLSGYAAYLIDTQKASLDYGPELTIKQTQLQEKILAAKNATEVFTARDGTKVYYTRPIPDKTLTNHERLSIAEVGESSRSFFGINLGEHTVQTFNDGMTFTLFMFCFCSFLGIFFGIVISIENYTIRSTCILCFALVTLICFCAGLAIQFWIGALGYLAAMLGFSFNSLIWPIFNLIKSHTVEEVEIQSA